jgi:hypothetical protein
MTIKPNSSRHYGAVTECNLQKTGLFSLSSDYVAGALLESHKRSQIQWVVKESYVPLHSTAQHSPASALIFVILHFLFNIPFVKFIASASECCTMPASQDSYCSGVLRWWIGTIALFVWSDRRRHVIWEGRKSSSVRAFKWIKLLCYERCYWRVLALQTISRAPLFPPS